MADLYLAPWFGRDTSSPDEKYDARKVLNTFRQFGGNSVMWEEGFQREEVCVLKISPKEAKHIVQPVLPGIKMKMTQEKQQGKERCQDLFGWHYVEGDDYSLP